MENTRVIVTKPVGRNAERIFIDEAAEGGDFTTETEWESRLVWCAVWYKPWTWCRFKRLHRLANWNRGVIYWWRCEPPRTGKTVKGFYNERFCEPFNLEKGEQS